MKKHLSVAVLAASALGLTGCGSTGQALLNDLLNNAQTEIQKTGDTSKGASILSSIAGAVTTSSTVEQKHLRGTWTYNGVKVYFESEDALAKIGGQAAATEVENKLNTQLSKVGFTETACTFTFYPTTLTTNTGNFDALINGKKMSGSYTLDTENGKLTLTTALGLGNMTCYVTRNGTTTLNLVFQSDKLLQVAQVAGSLTGNSTLSSLSSLMKNYNGMQIGLKLYQSANK